MQVHVIYAVNTQDFEEIPMVAVGKTRELAEQSFITKIKERWDTYAGDDDKEFYDNDFDNYELAWTKDEFITELSE